MDCGIILYRVFVLEDMVSMERVQYRALVKERREKLFRRSEPATVKDQGMFSLAEPEIKVGYWWGPWKLGARNALFCYDPEGLTDNPLHWIDLERMASSAQVLETIFEASEKPWATAEVLSNLLWALEDILDPRRNICADGTDLDFNPETRLVNVKDISN
jgi:hypothetical protein